MIWHHIILGPAYVHRKWIAYDSVGRNAEEREKDWQYINERCGWQGYGVHYLMTESPDWASVEALDSYFQNMEPVSLETFVSMMADNTVLEGLDVAKYILLRVKECTRHELQRLTCVCYYEYLSEYGDILFRDQFMDSPDGQTVRSLRDWLECTDFEVEKSEIQTVTWKKVHASGRIHVAKDGRQKERSIRDTLARHGYCKPR